MPLSMWCLISEGDLNTYGMFSTAGYDWEVLCEIILNCFECVEFADLEM